MFVPDGNDNVEPSRALHIPSASVVPESCPIVAERASVPDSASMVPVLVSVPLTRMVEVSDPAVFSIVASIVDCRGAAILVIDTRVALNQIAGDRFDLHGRGELAVAMERKVARSRLDDRAKIVERAVNVEQLIAGAREIDGPEVRKATDGRADRPSGPLKQAAGEVERGAAETDG